MKNLFLVTFFLLFVSKGFSQTDLPTDFLSKEFHKNRRDILRSKLPNNSVVVVFSNSLRNRANDVDYVFHQDPNFYYLTGYREPNAVLVIYKDNQTTTNGDPYNEVLFVQQKNKRAEQWNGYRLGIQGSKEELGFPTAKNGRDFVDSQIDFKSFDKVFIDGKFKDDYRDTRDGADVFELVKSFKIKSGYNPNSYLSGVKKYFYNLIKETLIENKSELVTRIKRSQERYTELKEDRFVQNYINAADEKLAKDYQQKISLEL